MSKIEAYPIPMALVSNESMPLVTDSRIVCGNKITLKLEHFAVRSWLECLVVEGNIPYLVQAISMISDMCILELTYSWRGILTEASFCLICDKLLASTVCTK